MKKITRKPSKEELKAAIVLLFRRRRCLEVFRVSENVPPNILKRSEKMYSEAIAKLKRMNFDAVPWMESPAGAVAYLQFCVNHDTRDASHDRCGQCNNYVMIDVFDAKKNEYDNIFLCILDHDGIERVVCKDFSDSGEPFPARLMASFNRCDGCGNQRIIKAVVVGIPDGIDEDRCIKGCNRLSAAACEFDTRSKS